MWGEVGGAEEEEGGGGTGKVGGGGGQGGRGCGWVGGGEGHLPADTFSPLRCSPENAAFDKSKGIFDSRSAAFAAGYRGRRN